MTRRRHIIFNYTYTAFSNIISHQFDSFGLSRFTYTSFTKSELMWQVFTVDKTKFEPATIRERTVCSLMGFHFQFHKTSFHLLTNYNSITIESHYWDSYNANVPFFNFCHLTEWINYVWHNDALDWNPYKVRYISRSAMKVMTYDRRLVRSDYKEIEKWWEFRRKENKWFFFWI